MNNHISLMKGRLGVYDKMSGQKFAVSGIADQQARLKQHGGNLQQERLIRDKRRSLDRATQYSYQGADICKVGEDSDEPVRALINQDKLKQDYDDKILSVGYEYNFKPGDVFEWIGTNTHWLIYLQDLTELAYFYGNIRKCSYQIAWTDEDGYHSTFAAVRGPVETKINFIQKHGISIDTPNHSLSILMPKTDEAVNYFKRYSKFYLQGDSVCWRVEATDWISTPGILEVIAVENYANQMEDDIEEGLVGSLIIEPENPNDATTEEFIAGETFIKPKKTYEYEFTKTAIGEWKVESKLPIILVPDGKKVKLKWDSSYSGQFDLYYGDFKKTIVVESLF